MTAGDGLCRVVLAPYKGGDKALLADLNGMITALGGYTVIHWTKYLHDGSDSSVQITVTDVGDPVVATWVEVPQSEWGSYDDLESCLYEQWVRVPYTADFAIGGDQALGTVTAAAEESNRGSGTAVGETTALTFSKDWQALIDAATGPDSEWNGHPVDVHVDLGRAGLSIVGESDTTQSYLWEGTME